MHYQQLGQHNKSALVLLHSGGMTAKEWQPQLDFFSQRYHLLLPDLPGHGKSMVPDRSKLSIALMGKSVVEMLQSESIGKTHLLGSSTGGAVALWIALNYPNLIDRLIIYRINYQKTTEGYAHTKQMSDPDYWRQYGMHTWMSKLHLQQGGKDAWMDVIASVSDIFEPNKTDHNHKLSDLSKIKAKTLLVAGDRDPLVPLSSLFDMADAINDSAVWVIPNASHVTATNTWRKSIFCQEIDKFISS